MTINADLLSLINIDDYYSMKKILYLLLFVVVAMSLNSCGTAKHDLNIFENLPGDSGTLTVPNTVVKIEPEMALVITVTSEEPTASAEFNPPYANPASLGSTAATGTPTLMPYEVDREGNIDFPRLGMIHVAGMTQMELKKYLTERISKYVKDPFVTVSLQGFRVVVMGEVKAPQTIYSTQNRFSVLDAFSMCGGLGDYALRDNILVMRRADDNTIEYKKLDLHDAKVVEDPYYWLKNEDVVVVSANNVKQDNSKYNQNNGYKLSVISTVVSTVSVIASLVIALTR